LLVNSAGAVANIDAFHNHCTQPPVLLLQSRCRCGAPSPSGIVNKPVGMQALVALPSK